ncbi:MAG TPA: VOC family protein [Rariglobus sp.]|nr:VOC family protein [Rariglobus sp.]
MARVSTWFHFAGNAEEAFNFYKSVFKTEFVGPIKRFSDLPAQPGQPPLSDKEAAKIMKIALPILGGHVIIGNDAPEFLGQRIQGNNVTLNLETDSRAETDRLFNALKEGGTVEYEPTEMPSGDCWACLIDRYGNEWMFSCEAK